MGDRFLDVPLSAPSLRSALVWRRRGGGSSGCGAGGADAGVTLRAVINAIELANTLLA